MFSKAIFRGLLIIALFLVVVMAWCLMSTAPVSAQCDTPSKSSCISCHAQEGHTVMGDWNTIHVRQDLCVNCHGGNGTVMDKTLAHQGFVAQPLSDIYTNCHGCHPIDYTVKSAQLAAQLNAPVGSCATPTTITIVNQVSGPTRGSIVTSSGNPAMSSFWKAFIWILLGLAIMAAFLLAVGWLDRHHLGV